VSCAATSASEDEEGPLKKEGKRSSGAPFVKWFALQCLPFITRDTKKRGNDDFSNQIFHAIGQKI
jgi:hypothetical protein